MTQAGGAAPLAVTQAQVDAFRLRRQLLEPRSSLGVTAVAAAVNGLHAQVISCAELMWWARSSAAAPDELDRALWVDRTVVKSWYMRGTMHVMDARDAGLWAAARGLEEPAKAWYRAWGVTARDIDALVEAVPEALEGGRALTRRELAAAVTAQHGADLGGKLLHSWGGLLKPIARNGLICTGPARGNEATFVRLDEWLGRPPDRWTPEAAGAEAARRYLTVYGPADKRDFMRWLGATPPHYRAVWSAIEPELVQVLVGGRAAWLLVGDVAELKAASPCDQARLLGGFDTWVLGHHDRGHLWSPERTPRISRTAGWISPVVLRGGRVVGVWSHELTRRASLRVSVELFEPLPPARRREVEQDAERLAAFFNRRLDLSIVAD